MDRAKPFCIAKRDVWEAYKQVKANRGAAGVDGQSIEDFDRDLNKNLYRIWNRMCSGSYFPPPVRRVDIPKGDSGGTRPLGIPTVADRIAQMVVKRYLEPILEPAFHMDSYGYRPGKSAHDALAVARRRCWSHDWVLDLDIKSFFDEIDWGLLMQAVRRHTDCKWVLLYLQRWLEAPVSISSFTMSSIYGCAGNTPTSSSNDMPTTLSAIAEAKHKRLNCVRRLKRGLRTANYNCIRKRPRSCIARMQIAPSDTRSSRSTFSATHSGQDWRATATENASSHLSQRSVKRLARGCGSAYAVGECIVEATLNWRRSPPGFARS